MEKLDPLGESNQNGNIDPDAAVTDSARNTEQEAADQETADQETPDDATEPAATARIEVLLAERNKFAEIIEQNSAELDTLRLSVAEFASTIADLNERLETLQAEHAGVVAQRDDLRTLVNAIDKDDAQNKSVRLKKRFVAHGHFGTILFRENQIVTDPATIKLLRSLKAPLGKV